MRGLFAIAIALLVCSCDRREYVCASSDQCVSGGTPGVCEPTGFCSFDDSSCEGGRRYESNAGDDLGGACVQAEIVPPVEVCGAASQACCRTGPACGGNGRCEGGTCTSCVTDVALGRHAVCVIKHDKTVWCAGENAAGQLGSGMVSAEPVTSWTQVLDATSTPIADATAITTHGQYVCAVRTGGTVWCWGEGFGLLAAQVVKTDDTPLTNIVEIDSGYCHRCARDDTGGVWCWGCNFNGHLGDGTTTLRDKAAPVLDAPMGAPMTGAISLTVGNSHACVRKAGDAVWCWGRNNRGHLGDNTLINRLNPVMVTGATAVTAGQHHTCSLRADGTVWCSGEGRRNRIGNGVVNDRDTGAVNYPTPVQVVTSRGGPPLTNVTQIAAGGVSCAVADKTVHCWGDNLYGETGTGASSTTPRPVLTTDRKPLTGVKRIVAHGPHACAFREDGELLCWGRGIDGVFGDGTLANRGLARPLGFTCQ